MEGLQHDTLQLIQETAVKGSGAAGKAVVLPIPGQPAHRVTIVTADGKVDMQELQPYPRGHTLDGLFEAIAYANTKGDAENSVVWFDECGLVIVLDDATRRDVANAELTFSPQFACLMEIPESGKAYIQTAFRRLLRVTLRGCTPNDMLLDWVSDCEFGSKGNSVGTITKDRSSFGKDIEQMAQSKDRGECPSEITLSMPVFDDPGLRELRRVVCDVEIQLAEQKFLLTPLPGEIKAAIDAEMANVEALLASEGGVKCPAFRGRP